MMACGYYLEFKFVRKANDSYFYPNIIKQALFLQLLCKGRANGLRHRRADFKCRIRSAKSQDNHQAD